ncbi:MAG TPA: ATP-binding cassette domain-containing protein [Bacteroidetes bacterium]|nr:ATP-binding cassette domain-containing protein [Bacteroidota bacterium]
MERLYIKNFGPLKEIDIELNKINLFIGENGSGKSVLAKIITIILNLDKPSEEKVIKEFEHYNINFIKQNSMILLYSNNELMIELKNKNIIFNNNIQSLKQPLSSIDSKLKDIFNLLPDDNKEKAFKQLLNLLKEKETNKIKKEDIKYLEKYLIAVDKLKSKYIPAERNLIAIFSKSISSMLVAEIPLPKFLLSFASEFEKAGNEIKELKLLNVKYVNGDSLDRHKIYFNDENYLPLEFSSSGIQSALPLYLTVKYFAKRYSSIVIEELEQNLFPKAQKETVEYIVGETNHNNQLFIMTHSPYILTSLNNLILAYDVKTQKGIEAIRGLVEESQCVNFDDVSAYSIVDGKAIDIMDREDRLIGINSIDIISDEINRVFDSLLAKMD